MVRSILGLGGGGKEVVLVPCASRPRSTARRGGSTPRSTRREGVRAQRVYNDWHADGEMSEPVRHRAWQGAAANGGQLITNVPMDWQQVAGPPSQVDT